MVKNKTGKEKRIKVQTMLSLEPWQHDDLEKLHKATRITRQVLLREGVDMLIARYKRKGVI